MKVSALRRLRGCYYPAVIAALTPLNALLSLILARRFLPGSVLHVSYMGHIPFQTVAVLRQNGIRADYLAIGESAVWSQADFQLASAGSAWARPFVEFSLVWRVVARYSILHLHFMVTPTRTGWELPWLKRMGRKVVIHYRGCEIRDRERNMAMHPAINICQQCDYNPYICKAEHNVLRRRLAESYGDAFLVTTPDLLDFVPDATHLPFFAPTGIAPRSPREVIDELTIVHATNHPGIEGTEAIRSVINGLVARGYRIRFIHLQNAPYREVVTALATADLAIGKMKMGYYANAQIESMAAGVPTVTWVRDEFMTPALRDSGFIITSLEKLEETLEYYASNPHALSAKALRARESISRLHDNAVISAEYAAVYRRMSA